MSFVEVFLDFLKLLSIISICNIFVNLLFNKNKEQIKEQVKQQINEELLNKVELQLKQKIKDEKNNQQLDGEVENLLCERSKLELDKKILSYKDKELMINSLEHVDHELKIKQNLLETELNEENKNKLNDEVEKLLVSKTEMESNVINYVFTPDHEKY